MSARFRALATRRALPASLSGSALPRRTLRPGLAVLRAAAALDSSSRAARPMTG